jgi:hypothetical protein
MDHHQDQIPRVLKLIGLQTTIYSKQTDTRYKIFNTSNPLIKWDGPKIYNIENNCVEMNHNQFN